MERRSRETPVGLRGERQSQPHFRGQPRRAGPGQPQGPLPGRTRGAQRGSSRRPGHRGGGRRGRSRDGSPSSDFGRRRRRAPNCGVERVQSEAMGRRDEKSETPPPPPRRGPVKKRKEPSELKRRGGTKRDGAGARGPAGAKQELCYETKGRQPTASNEDFGEVREGRRSAAVTSTSPPRVRNS